MRRYADQRIRLHRRRRGRGDDRACGRWPRSCSSTSSASASTRSSTRRRSSATCSAARRVTPLVIRTHVRRRARARRPAQPGALPLFTHIPGLKVVIPSNAYDAKGLLIQAIRDDDPVMFLRAQDALRPARARSRTSAYVVPFGEANIVREGDDVTIVALGRMVHFAASAAEQLAAEGYRLRPSSTRAPPRRSTRTRILEAVGADRAAGDRR